MFPILSTNHLVYVNHLVYSSGHTFFPQWTTWYTLPFRCFPPCHWTTWYTLPDACLFSFSLNHLVYSSFQMFSPMSLNHLVYSSFHVFFPSQWTTWYTLPCMFPPPPPKWTTWYILPMFFFPSQWTTRYTLLFICFSSPLIEPPGILFLSHVFLPLSMNHLVYSQPFTCLSPIDPVCQPHQWTTLYTFPLQWTTLYTFPLQWTTLYTFPLQWTTCTLFHFNEPLVHFSTSMNHFVYFSLTSHPKHAFSVFMFVCQWTILWLCISPLFTVSCQYTICPIFPFPVHLFVNHLIRSFPSSSFCVSERPYTLFSIFMFLYQ